MCECPMCFLIREPFLPSTSALSLVRLERDFVCSISTFWSSRATRSLMYSLPLSEWNPRMRNGNRSSATSIAGSRKNSAIPSTHKRISHCVTSSTRLMWYTPFCLSRSPWWPESTRRNPGFPSVFGFLRLPIDTCTARVFSMNSTASLYRRDPLRRLYRCETEIFAIVSYSLLPYTSNSLRRISFVASPEILPCALSVVIKRSISRSRYLTGNECRPLATTSNSRLFFLRRASFFSLSRERFVIVTRYERTMFFSRLVTRSYRRRTSVASIHPYIFCLLAY